MIREPRLFVALLVVILFGIGGAALAISQHITIRRIRRLREREERSRPRRLGEQ